MTTEAAPPTAEAPQAPIVDADAAPEAAEAPKQQPTLRERLEAKIAEAEPATDEPEEDAAPVVSDESDDGPKDEADGADEPPTDERVVLALPGRGSADEDAEFDLPVAALEEAGVDVQALVERVNQLRNGYNRTEALKAREDQVQADRDEMDYVERSLRDDPAAFMLQHVRPDVRNDVATSLIARMDDAQYNALVDTLVEWEKDPARRKMTATERENARLRDQVKRSDETQQERATKTEARKIAGSIKDLIPEAWDTGRGERFFALAIDSLARHAEANNIARLDPAEVPAILAGSGVLADYGLDSSSQPSMDGADEPPAKPAAQSATPSKKDPKERVARRKDAASTSPAGVGAGSPAGLKPPKGQSSEDRFKWLRKTLGVTS